MSRAIRYIFFLTIPSFFLFFACNPNCDTVAATNISIEPAAVLPGSQVKIRSIPANYLQDRKVFIDESTSSNRKKEIPAYFSEEHGALVAQIPDDALGNIPVYVEYWRPAVLVGLFECSRKTPIHRLPSFFSGLYSRW